MTVYFSTPTPTPFAPVALDAVLGLDVTVNVADTWTDILSLTIPAGSHLISGQFMANGVAVTMLARIYDGTNVVAICRVDSSNSMPYPIVPRKMVYAAGVTLKLQAYTRTNQPMTVRASEPITGLSPATWLSAEQYA